MTITNFISKKRSCKCYLNSSCLNIYLDKNKAEIFFVKFYFKKVFIIKEFTMITPNKNLSQFEEDKYLFTKYWNAPIFSDEWRERVKTVYLIPTYGFDDPNIIFGNCV